MGSGGRPEVPLSFARRLLSPIVLVATLALTASAGTYVVRPGDTLSGIAGRLGVSVTALAEANGITDPNRVFAGQTLEVPGARTQPNAPAPSAGRQHVVSPGETLTAIAARYATSVRAIVEANDIRDPNRVHVGLRLRIPDAPPPTGLPARLLASPARMALIPHFERWAVANELDPALVMAVAWQESGWQNDVVSQAGAVGIGQLLPSTARFISRDLIGVPLDPAVPADNIRMMARYLRYLLSRTGGDLDLALAGYFQGLASVASIGMLPATVDYIAIVRVLRPRFADA
jgi:soluble lytic murein transglycosylase-like protein